MRQTSAPGSARPTARVWVPNTPREKRRQKRCRCHPIRTIRRTGLGLGVRRGVKVRQQPGPEVVVPHKALPDRPRAVHRHVTVLPRVELRHRPQEHELDPAGKVGVARAVPHLRRPDQAGEPGVDQALDVVVVAVRVGVRAGAVRLPPEIVAAALHPGPLAGVRVHLVEQGLERKAVDVVELRAREPGRERRVVPEEHNPTVVLVQLEPGDAERDQVRGDVLLPDGAAAAQCEVGVPTAGGMPGRGVAAATSHHGP